MLVIALRFSTDEVKNEFPKSWLNFILIPPFARKPVTDVVKLQQKLNYLLDNLFRFLLIEMTSVLIFGSIFKLILVSRHQSVKRMSCNHKNGFARLIC